MSLLSVYSSPDLFDDEAALLPSVEHSAVSACRMPDGRALSWAEYGSIRGLPCLLIPDINSSRLAPDWLLHDSALPAHIRLLCIDRPGVGTSDPVGLGGHDDPASDLRRMIDTMAVGRVAVVGVGAGISDALALAAQHPEVVVSVTGVSVRLGASARRGWGRRTRAHHGALDSWIAAAGDGADLSREKTWQRALGRMDADARAALSERWREPDFRQAVAADAAQRHPDSSIPASPPVEGDWLTLAAQVHRPVHLWHGEGESGTPASALRQVVDARPGWELSVIPGASALWGAWPRITSSAVAPLRHPMPA